MYEKEGGRILLYAETICLLKDNRVSEAFPLYVLKCEIWKQDQQGRETHSYQRSTQTIIKQTLGLYGPKSGFFLVLNILLLLQPYMWNKSTNKAIPLDITVDKMGI